ncbi:hypothetical protein EV586_105220 [Tumebacillus sp. BK434]|uniref:hypothetical protein n=1 Tax=Tumebacillus sp. BK434 TaxID=2512169 RepID=UPI001049C540|nr:hypothetical protein [Tumebacillus sp. BK434]TCP53874.1 hypothetical protein EV586_105220 [Tumebacillus sp. BK434]
MSSAANALKEKSRCIVVLTQQLKDAEQERADAERYKTRLDTMTSWKNQLLTRTKTLAMFQQHGISIEISNREVKKLQSLLQRLQEGFAANNASIIDTDTMNTVGFGVKSFVRSFDDCIKDAWGSYTKQKVPQISDSFLSAMENVKSFQQEVQTIRTCKNQLTPLSQTMPRTKTDLELFERHLSRMNEAWVKLSSDSVPDEVLDFLKAAGTGSGASLDSYTDVVKEWLSKNNVQSQLSIRISTGGTV